MLKNLKNLKLQNLIDINYFPYSIKKRQRFISFKLYNNKEKLEILFFLKLSVNCNKLSKL